MSFHTYTSSLHQPLVYTSWRRQWRRRNIRNQTTIKHWDQSGWDHRGDVDLVSCDRRKLVWRFRSRHLCLCVWGREADGLESFGHVWFGEEIIWMCVFLRRCRVSQGVLRFEWSKVLEDVQTAGLRWTLRQRSSEVGFTTECQHRGQTHHSVTGMIAFIHRDVFSSAFLWNCLKDDLWI